MSKHIWLVVILVTVVSGGVGYAIGLLWNPDLSNTALYFFSALFQGNAALFAILGVFVVFRLQIAWSSVRDAEDGLSEMLTEEQLRAFKNASLEDKDKIIKGGIESREEIALDIPESFVKAVVQSWANSEQDIEMITDLSKTPIILMPIFMEWE